jgi:hypothetical protein
MDGRCVIVLIFSAAIAPAMCRAQDERMTLTEHGSSASGQGLLVLVDGKVLNGQFTPRPDGYDVRLAAGRTFIGSERVRFFATDLPDAYQRMRLSQAELTPEVHVELARWCLTNKLYQQAHREVLDALHLDPNRTDAKRILAALVQNSESSGRTSSGSGLTEYPSIGRSIGPSVETRSLGGLSRSVAQDFTRRVQPLLMNKCANAGCHGGGTGSSFQLASAHRFSSPTIAERNLAAVLRQIDLAHPAKSSLLVEVEGSHGNLNVPLFRGRLGSQQLDILRNWVVAAANDIAPKAHDEDSTVEREIQLTSAAGVQTDRSGELSRRNPVVAVPHGRQLSSTETDPGFLAEAARANAHDEFNPSVFNARFHGAAGSESKSEPTDPPRIPGESAPVNTAQR